MTNNKRVVFRQEIAGKTIEIVRHEYWGFRCNATEVEWIVNVNGSEERTALRLKDAKTFVARHFQGA